MDKIVFSGLLLDADKEAKPNDDLIQMNMDRNLDDLVTSMAELNTRERERDQERVRSCSFVSTASGEYGSS
jgi:hypothetical protein